MTKPQVLPFGELSWENFERLCYGLAGKAERLAIETTFFGGLTHAEAAAQLKQPLGTIKTRIRSGLHKLRQALTADAGKP